MDPRKTILVVEDEADEVTYLTALFEDNGFAVISARNGHEGFMAARAHHPDAITLDVTMPEESGVRMYRELQADASTADIPVVIITGVSHEFKRFIETRKHVPPPAGYFDKPPDRAELLAKIREIVGAAVTG